MTTPTLDQGPRLKLNKSGYWTLVSAERGEDGKWRTRTVSCGTRDEAQAQAFRHSYVVASAEPSDMITVGSLIDAYLEDAREQGLTMGQAWALKPVKALLGAYRPEEITIDVQRAYKRQRRVSDGTLRRELSALGTAFKWAVLFRKLDHTQRPVLKLPDQPEARQDFLNEADEARLWSIAANDRDSKGRLGLAGLFVCIALGTGARSGAIYSLTWDRVDLDIEKTDFRVPGERVTRKKKVSVYVNKRLLPVLRQARADYPFQHKVIPHKMRYRVENFLKRHGFGHITPHVFRHTFVTLSLRAGLPVWKVAALVGMSPLVVQTVYGHHVVDAHARDDANHRFGG